MSIRPLHRSGAAGALVTEARSAVSRGGRVPVGTLGESELTGLVAELAELESQVAAWRLRLAAEADARRVSDQTRTPTPLRSWPG